MRTRNTLLNLAVYIAAAAAVAAVFITGVRSVGRSAGEEAQKRLEDSVRRAAVSCYAMEGRYPDTLAYLRENYGIYIDEARFEVYYDVFASNIMPDITVLEK